MTLIFDRKRGVRANHNTIVTNNDIAVLKNL